MNTIRVRFAPSPTGNLHVGSAHTALFNWLFARHACLPKGTAGGKFILRVEDTDRERSRAEYEKNIIEGLRWLGLDWDEGPDVGGSYGPYRQTERLDIYEKYLNVLLEKNLAYYCTCTNEELEAERAAALKEGIAPKYNGKCRAKNLKTGPGVIRFKVPEKELAFTDIIRGELKFDGALIGDIVIAKGLREPLYNFAVVVDDACMKISHVIRGEEHIANTPRQLAIMEALGFTPPQYAHLPLMLDKQRAKLSKRAGVTAIDEYRAAGYLPEALLNFLALMGWHPKGNEEKLSLKQIIEEFSLERVQKAGAVFDVEKLAWLNGQYIRELSLKDITARLETLFPEFSAYRARFSEKKLMALITITKERLQTLSDFMKHANVFLAPDAYEASLLIWKKSTAAAAREHLSASRELLASLPETEFEITGLQKALMPFAEQRGRGDVLWPLRVALSGAEASPGPFELMSIVGKEETLRRIDAAIQKL